MVEKVPVVFAEEHEQKLTRKTSQFQHLLPLNHSCCTSGYYSNARFILLALRKLIEAYENTQGFTPYTTFDGDRTLNLRDIESTLVESLDWIFDVLAGAIDQSEVLSNELYHTAKHLFMSSDGLPDGSAIYGVLLNSHGVAINGFGASPNFAGQNATIHNVSIHDMSLKVNEIPAICFIENFDDIYSNSFNKGPFGDIFDLRKVISYDHALQIESHGVDPLSLSDIVYLGNPLADAQIALSIHGRLQNVSYEFGSVIAIELEEWAQGLIPFPSEYAHFECNGDIMFHQNKGVIGLRMDGIEDAAIGNLSIHRLQNRTPSLSSACGFDGNVSFHDDGLGEIVPDTKEIATDTKGIVITGGDTQFIGPYTMITTLYSLSGDTVAIETMGESVVDFDGDLHVAICGLSTSSFSSDLCTVRYSESTTLIGDITEGLEQTECVQYVWSALRCTD